MQAIVCVSQNWGIGRDGALLFRLSADLRRFRELTAGKTIVYGSRTLATFPGRKPLQDCRNIILTRSQAPVDGAELAHTAKEAVAIAGGDAFVIGGASVYTQLLPYCSRVLATRVELAVKADSYFPNLDNHPDWRLESESERMEEDGVAFHFLEYARLRAWQD